MDRKLLDYKLLSQSANGPVGILLNRRREELYFAQVSVSIFQLAPLPVNSVNRLSMMTRDVKRRELLRTNRTTITTSAAAVAVAERKSQGVWREVEEQASERAQRVVYRDTSNCFEIRRVPAEFHDAELQRQPLDVGSGVEDGRLCVCMFLETALAYVTRQRRSGAESPLLLLS